MPNINLKTRQCVIDEIMNCSTQREVATLLKISQTSVSYIWRKYLKSRTLEDKQRSGRPMKTTARDRRMLIMGSKKEPFFTARQLYDKVHIGKSISLVTVRRILREGNLFGRVAVKKPILNKMHIRKRLSWCKSYFSMQQSQWDNILFSDETRIELFPTRRRYVRRPIGSQFQNRYVTKTIRQGGFSVLVWGCIKSDGTRILIRCPPRLDSLTYQRVLREGLLPLYDHRMTFMQDGAPCYRSASTSKFLDNEKICVLSDWPPLSPDLNIIENLWSILKDRVCQRPNKTIFNLWNIIVEEWNGIPNDTIKNMYRSIPRRLQMTVKNKGLPIKY